MINNDNAIIMNLSQFKQTLTEYLTMSQALQCIKTPSAHLVLGMENNRQSITARACNGAAVVSRVQVMKSLDAMVKSFGFCPMRDRHMIRVAFQKDSSHSYFQTRLCKHQLILWGHVNNLPHTLCSIFSFQQQWTVPWT